MRVSRKYNKRKRNVSKKILKGGSNSPKPEIKFAVLAIFKNEAMGIREWVDHYKWQGIDEILLLDNNSTDGGGDLIKNIEHVTVIHAPKKHAQIENYTTIGLPWLKEKKIDVVAVLDLDEYMFGTDGKNLKQHVIEIFGATPRPSKFSCNWTIFGSSGLDKQPANIRKSFTLRAKDLNKDIKSVMWVNDIIDKIDQHNAIVSGTTIQCPPGIQLNHYIIQSKQYFKNIKMTRGSVNSAVSNSMRNWKYFNSFNSTATVEDTKLRDLVIAHEKNVK